MFTYPRKVCHTIAAEYVNVIKKLCEKETKKKYKIDNEAQRKKNIYKLYIMIKH